MSRITEIKRIKVFQGCLINPVCLSWRNKLGEWGTWVFDGTQKINIDVKEAIEFERFIETLSSTSTIQDYLLKRANYQYTLGYENLPVKDIKGIEPMLMSPRVRMLITAPYEYPVKWVTVRIPPGRFATRETGESRYSLEFPILLPETIIQSQ